MEDSRQHASTLAGHTLPEDMRAEAISKYQTVRPRQEPPPPRRVLLPLGLFIATCFSTYYVGGPVYMVAVMGILLTHEMGHFLSVSPADYTDRQDQLMHAYTDVRGQKITHAQVDQANP